MQAGACVAAGSAAQGRSTIVGSVPRLRQIAAEMGRSLALLFAWDVAVTLFHVHAPFQVLPLFGAVMELLLGVF